MDLSSFDRRRFLQAFAGFVASGTVLAASGARIRIASSGHFPPLSFLGEDGQLKGVLVDELRLMGDAAGLALDFVDRPWARGQQMVRSGTLDGFCTIPTEERRSYALFAPTPLYVEDSVLVGRADDPRIAQARTLKDVETLRIAEPLGTGWIKEHLDDRQIVWSSDVDNILSMIDAGRVDAAFFGRAAAQAALAGFSRPDRLRLVVFPALPRDQGFCFGLRKTLPGAGDMIARIDGVLRDLTASGAFEPIRVLYLTPGEPLPQSGNR